MKGKIFFRALQLLVFGIIMLSVSGCSLITPTRTVKYIRYPVKSGDSLYTIGQRFGTTSDRLADINGISDPLALQVGEYIKVPLPKAAPSSNQSEARASLASSRPAPSKDSVNLVKLTSARYYIGNLAWPVAKAEVNSKFGRRWLSFHEGIDMRAPEGSPIVAAHDGQVVYSDDGLKGYGNLVVVKGSRGLMTVYAHNKRNLVGRGAQVHRGQLIAYLGQSGKATGPHLHFETRVKDSSGKNVAVDPLVFYR